MIQKNEEKYIWENTSLFVLVYKSKVLFECYFSFLFTVCFIFAKICLVWVWFNFWIYCSTMCGDTTESILLHWSKIESTRGTKRIMNALITELVNYYRFNCKQFLLWLQIFNSVIKIQNGKVFRFIYTTRIRTSGTYIYTIGYLAVFSYQIQRILIF